MRVDRRFAWTVAALAILAGCAGPPAKDRAPKRPPDVSAVPDAVPRSEPRSKSGNPPFYEVNGHRYYVMASGRNHVERGVASWYGQKFHGRRTSSGETYDMYAMTAAHKTLPLPIYARVTNLGNGRSVIVRINDRGPFVDNRIVDLSYSAAARLDMLGQGTAMVELETIEPGRQIADKDRRALETAPAKTTMTGGAMYVQAGAFSDSGNARTLAGRLRDTGLEEVVILEDDTGSRPLYRVRVGPVTGVEHYDWMIARMSDLGIEDAYLAVD